MFWLRTTRLRVKYVGGFALFLFVTLISRLCSAQDAIVPLVGSDTNNIPSGICPRALRPTQEDSPPVGIIEEIRRGREDREQVRTSQTICTATLVFDSQTIMTAAHCLVGRQLSRLSFRLLNRPESGGHWSRILSFKPMPFRGANSPPVSYSDYERGGRCFPNQRRFRECGVRDVALARLATPVLGATPYIVQAVPSNFETSMSEFEIFGAIPFGSGAQSQQQQQQDSPGDGDRGDSSSYHGLYVDRCQLPSDWNYVAARVQSTTPGDSGGPVFALRGGQRYLVAVNAARQIDRSDRPDANYFAPVADFRASRTSPEVVPRTGEVTNLWRLLVAEHAREESNERCRVQVDDRSVETILRMSEDLIARASHSSSSLRCAVSRSSASIAREIEGWIIRDASQLTLLIEMARNSLQASLTQIQQTSLCPIHGVQVPLQIQVLSAVARQLPTQITPCSVTPIGPEERRQVSTMGTNRCAAQVIREEIAWTVGHCGDASVTSPASTAVGLSSSLAMPSVCRGPGALQRVGPQLQPATTDHASVDSEVTERLQDTHRRVDSLWVGLAAARCRLGLNVIARFTPWCADHCSRRTETGVSIDDILATELQNDICLGCQWMGHNQARSSSDGSPSATLQ
jgi:hypothetical protein